MADRKQLEDALIAAHDAGDTEAAQVIANEIKGMQQTSATSGAMRATGLAARGLIPPAVGAIGGGALAGPPGAVVGSLAVPLADIVAGGYNVIAPKLGGREISMPSQNISNLLTQAGLPVPQTTGERAIVAGGSALGGTGGTARAFQQLGKEATTQVGRNIATQLGREPERQLLASVPSGAASQYATEKTYDTVGSPALAQTAGMLAGAATGLPFAFKAPKTGEIAPDVSQLKQEASGQYKFAEDAGAVFKKNAVGQFNNSLQAEMKQQGFDPRLHPKVAVALDEINKAGNKNLTLSEAEILRRIGNASKASIDADERRLGSILIDKLDEFVEGAQPSQLQSGNKQAIEALTDARDLWKRSKKGEIMNEIFDVAELRASTNFTQSGMEQAIRNRLTNLATNSKKMRTFTKNEQELIKQAAKGGSLQNVLRYVGKLAPTGIVSAGGGAGLGYLLGGQAGALVAPATGIVARAGATKLGLDAFNELRKAMLLGRQAIPEPSVTQTMGVRGGLLNPMYNDPMLQLLQGNTNE